MLRIALGFSKNMHKYMLILCIFIHIFRNIMHKVDAYFSSSVGTLALERSNALERIVENAQGTFRFTLQERKNNCN